MPSLGLKLVYNLHLSLAASQAKSEQCSHMRSGRGNRVASCHPQLILTSGWEAVYCISQALSFVKIVKNVGDGVPNPHLIAGGSIAGTEGFPTTAGMGRMRVGLGGRECHLGAQAWSE